MPSKVYQSLCISTPQRYTEQITNACTIWLFGRRLYGTNPVYIATMYIGEHGKSSTLLSEVQAVWCPQASCGYV